MSSLLHVGNLTNELMKNVKDLPLYKYNDVLPSECGIYFLTNGGSYSWSIPVDDCEMWSVLYVGISKNLEKRFGPYPEGNRNEWGNSQHKAARLMYLHPEDMNLHFLQYDRNEYYELEDWPCWRNHFDGPSILLSYVQELGLAGAERFFISLFQPPKNIVGNVRGHIRRKS